MPHLNLLSGGAAQALVAGLADDFQRSHGANVQGTFGAVGAMRDKLLGGDPCDVLVLTQALIEQLAAQGHVQGASARPLGAVFTGVAVRSGEAVPDVSTPDALKAALAAAPAIYFPDPEKATAGIHFRKVLEALGLQETQPRWRTFPNGATAMREMAASGQRGAIGCTQVTEILYAQGVELAGLLPKAFELATVYTAAVCTKAADTALASAFVSLLASDEAARLRAHCGFVAG